MLADIFRLNSLPRSPSSPSPITSCCLDPRHARCGILKGPSFPGPGIRRRGVTPRCSGSSRSSRCPVMSRQTIAATVTSPRMRCALLPGAVALPVPADPWNIADDRQGREGLGALSKARAGALSPSNGTSDWATTSRRAAHRRDRHERADRTSSTRAICGAPSSSSRTASRPRVLLPADRGRDALESMGTRHRRPRRHEVDAIVVVVSEEMGRTSLCVGQKLTTDLCRRLATQLREHSCAATAGALHRRGGSRLNPRPDGTGATAKPVEMRNRERTPWVGQTGHLLAGAAFRPDVAFYRKTNTIVASATFNRSARKVFRSSTAANSIRRTSCPWR